MRILQVCPRYTPYIGGVEEHVRNISERLSKTHEVTVATTDPIGDLPKEEIVGDVRVLRFRSFAPKEAYYASLSLKRYLNTKSVANFDVIHAHSYHAFPALYVAGLKGAIRLIFSPHYHGGGHTFFRNLLHFPYKAWGQRIFERAGKIICVSEFERSLVAVDFRVPETKTVVIPNGINMREYANFTRTKKQHRTILYVGRLEKYKGLHHLVKILPLLDNNIILEIVGVGPYKRELTNLAESLGVRNRLIFFNNLSREMLLQRYAAAGLFALLSEHEAYGICVAEALAMKTPCIVANTSALKEWIDNSNCFGVNITINLKVLVNMVNAVLGKEIMGVKLWDWDDVVHAVVKVYQEIIRTSENGNNGIELLN